MAYSFRICFAKSLSRASSTLHTEERKLVLSLPEKPCSITFSSQQEDVSLQETDQLVVSGCGYESQEAAEKSGQRIKNALMVACAKHQIGLDFSVANIAILESGIMFFEQQTGQKHIESPNGKVVVFNTEYNPIFISSHVKLRINEDPDIFFKTFTSSLEQSPSFSEHNQLAFRLFNTALFQPDPLATFLFLVMVIEALSDYAPRSESAISHVDMLIESTKNNNSLTKEDSDSMVGALRWLKQESIRQAGKRLIAERLGDRMYADMRATKFFSECYDLRSSLVHGGTHDHEKFNKLAPHLSFLVSDLLTAPVLGPRDEE